MAILQTVIHKPTVGMLNHVVAHAVRKVGCSTPEVIPVKYSLSAVLFSVVLVLSSCSGGDGGDTDTHTDATATGLDAPWSMAVTENGTVLVSERNTEKILQVDAGETTEITTVPGVDARGEGGLLGIVVNGGDLYAYTTTATDNRVLTLSLDDPDQAPETVIDGLPKGTNHNGGRLAFGPDGMLYVTVGDAGNREDAQDVASSGGTILRVTPEGEVPEDNPFPDSPVYSYGHRNVQGIGWAEDGTMYASEFGQDTWDELNIITAGGNYGWPVVEGQAGRREFIDPVQQWAPSEASPSGIAVTQDAVWIANLRGERLREVPLSDPSTATEHHVGEFGRLRDVVAGPDGELLVLTSNTDGRGTPGADDDRIVVH